MSERRSLPTAFPEQETDALRISNDLSAGPKPIITPNDESSRVLIIGGGVAGLTTAWFLLDSGYHVTIVSKEWASYDEGPRLTSQVAGALWELPPGGCGPQAIGDKLPMVQKWALESLEVYRAIAADQTLREAYGLKMRKFTAFHTNSLHEDAIKADKIQFIKGTRLEGFSQGTHLFDKYGVNTNCHGGLVDAYEHDAPVIDSDVAMSFLMRLVQSKGARLVTDIIHGDIVNQEDSLLHLYKADAIVNATGVWAREAAADENVYPLRGGMLRMINDGTDFPKVENAMVVSTETRHNGNFHDMAVLIPRNDNILLLGSILNQKSWCLDLSPTCETIKDMRERCEALLPALKNARLDPKYPLSQGRRPMRIGSVRVERDQRKTCQGQWSRTVHSYGHAAAGWSLAFGSARQVLRLLDDLFDKKGPGLVYRNKQGVYGQKHGTKAKL